MPELPEVETVMRGLEPVMLANQISTVKLNRKNLRIPFPVTLKPDIENKKIVTLKRRAKYILVCFEGGMILAIHLGMSGRVQIFGAKDDYHPQKHDHVIFTMKMGERIVYNDPRRFGMIFTVTDNEFETHKAFSHLGPEPLSNSFSAVYLKDKLKNKTASIKQALLDQTNVVGVGNIYACEALYLSKIDPTKPCNKISKIKYEELVQAIREVLTKAIAAGGSTLKDFRHADGELGYFQHNFTVYDQKGKSCPDCDCNLEKTGGIQRIVQSGRSTFYCTSKQK